MFVAVAHKHKYTTEGWGIALNQQPRYAEVVEAFKKVRCAWHAWHCPCSLPSCVGGCGLDQALHQPLRPPLQRALMWGPKNPTPAARLRLLFCRSLRPQLLQVSSLADPPWLIAPPAALLQAVDQGRTDHWSKAAVGGGESAGMTMRSLRQKTDTMTFMTWYSSTHYASAKQQVVEKEGMPNPPATRVMAQLWEDWRALSDQERSQAVAACKLAIANGKALALDPEAVEAAGALEGLFEEEEVEGAPPQTGRGPAPAPRLAYAQAAALGREAALRAPGTSKPWMRAAYAVAQRKVPIFAGHAGGAGPTTHVAFGRTTGTDGIGSPSGLGTAGRGARASPGGAASGGGGAGGGPVAPAPLGPAAGTGPAGRPTVGGARALSYAQTFASMGLYD